MDWNSGGIHVSPTFKSDSNLAFTIVDTVEFEDDDIEVNKTVRLVFEESGDLT